MFTNVDNDVKKFVDVEEIIEEKIPDYFYPAFAGELCSIFGVSIFRKLSTIDYDEDGSAITNWANSYYDLHTYSSGWFRALEITCKKLEMEWLIDYWVGLEWYDSDIFNELLEDKVVTNFINKAYKSCIDNPYFNYLLDINER